IGDYAGCERAQGSLQHRVQAAWRPCGDRKIPGRAMIQKLKLARGTPFLVFNAAAFLFIVIFLLAPVMAHFVARGEDISDSAAQLAHFQNVMRAAKKSAGSP